MSMIPTRPNFVDLAFGIDGTFAGMKETSEEGMVIPLYYPANSLIGSARPKEYPVKVPRDAVIGPFTPSAREEGVDDVVVIVNTAGGETPMLDQLDTNISERMNQLRQQLEEERWRREDERRRRMETEDEQEQEKRKQESRGGGRSRQQQGAPFDRSGGNQW